MKSSFARRQPRKVGQDEDEDGGGSGQSGVESQEQGMYHYEPVTVRISDTSRRHVG